MSDKAPLEETLSLGAFLRSQREQKGVSLEDVGEATKISLPVLRAIEEDNFERMPAEAFCRGFYSLYANYLELDPEEILERYRVSRGIAAAPSKKQAKPPVSKSQRFSNYAEPSPVSPVSGTAALTIISIIVLTGTCWYLNWNPITFLSSIILPQQTSVTNGNPETLVEETATAGVTTENTHQETGIKTTEQSQNKAGIDLPAVTLYNLKGTFSNSGILKVTLDDGFVLEKHFTAGETLQWEVKRKIVLDMPETISGKLNLNGIEIPLPPAENGRRKLSLPEDLLD